MPEAPTPDVIAKAMSHLSDRAEPLAKEYRWLYPSAFARTNRGTAGGTSGGSANEDGSPTNQVGNLIQSTWYLRGKMTSAGKHMLEGLALIHLAQSELNEVQTAIDRGAPLEVSVHERAVEHPADRGDVRRAGNAQKRRNGRMRDHALPWSESEVTGA